jgi:hypothetical protein
MAKKSPGNTYAASGSAFFGCMLIGTGVGHAVGSKYTGVGWLIGTGLGFLVMAFLRTR